MVRALGISREVWENGRRQNLGEWEAKENKREWVVFWVRVEIVRQIDSRKFSGKVARRGRKI